MEYWLKSQINRLVKYRKNQVYVYMNVCANGGFDNCCSTSTTYTYIRYRSVGQWYITTMTQPIQFCISVLKIQVNILLLYI